MDIVNTISSKCNSKVKINFDGGDLSSDSGLLLIKEFAARIGFLDQIKRLFKTTDTAMFRIHADAQNLLQVIYQITVAYFEYNCVDEPTRDPVFTALLEKDALEEADCKYAIHLKDNKRLRALAADGDEALYRTTKDNVVDYAVEYGEFMCCAAASRIRGSLCKSCGKSTPLRPS